MNKKNEKTITIIGKEVRIRYCSAAETGFEKISGKSIADINYTLQNDLLMLAIASIVAAYSRSKEEPPVNSDDLLYEATPNDITELINALIEVRAAWYGIPKVLEEQLAKEAEEAPDAAQDEKNA